MPQLTKKSPEQLREFIHSLHGSLSLKPGEKSLVQDHLEERLAGRKAQRHDASPRKGNRK
jgi:hypothetical protein